MYEIHLFCQLYGVMYKYGVWVCTIRIVITKLRINWVTNISLSKICSTVERHIRRVDGHDPLNSDLFLGAGFPRFDLSTVKMVCKHSLRDTSMLIRMPAVSISPPISPMRPLLTHSRPRTLKLRLANLGAAQRARDRSRQLPGSPPKPSDRVPERE